MSRKLIEAYKIIFGDEPPADMEIWRIAEKVMEKDNFSFRKLGEELAGEAIYEVVLDIPYPDKETTERIVGRAEGLASELWDDLPDEVHMADLERKRREMKKYNGGTMSEISSRK